MISNMVIFSFPRTKINLQISKVLLPHDTNVTLVGNNDLYFSYVVPFTNLTMPRFMDSL